jgi:hypothetical protein
MRSCELPGKTIFLDNRTIHENQQLAHELVARTFNTPTNLRRTSRVTYETTEQFNGGKFRRPELSTCVRHFKTADEVY